MITLNGWALNFAKMPPLIAMMQLKIVLEGIRIYKNKLINVINPLLALDVSC